VGRREKARERMEEESGASRRDEERIRNERQGSEVKWRVKWEGEIEEDGYRGLAEEKETKEDEEADSAGEGESVGAGCEACWEQLPQWRWRWRILWRVRACRDRANRALAAWIERGDPSLPSQSSDPWLCSTGRSGMKRIGGSIREQVEEESKGMSIVCASKAGDGR
jgi:hypothetical protein